MALTKTYSIEIEGQQAQATVGQIKEEIQRLEAEMEGLTLGTAEADAAIQKLGKAKGSLKELDDAIDALNPKEKAAAFVDFANGIVGAFGVATVAAESFGLSSGTIEKYQAKLLSLMTVMQGVEAVHRALNSETQSVLKSVLGLGNTWTIAGVKAKLFGTTTRAALTATGIGIFVVLLGTIVANWDSISGAAGKFFNKMKTSFPGLFKFFDTAIAKLRDIGSFLSFGLIDDAATAAEKKVDAAEKRMAEKRIATRKRLIAEEEAAGRSTYNLKQAQLADELKLLEKGTDAYKDKWAEIRTLKAGHDKSLADAADKARQEELDKQKKASEEALRIAEEAYAKRRELEGKALEEALAAAQEERNYKLELAKSYGASQQQLLRVEIENIADQQADLIAQGKAHSSEYLGLKNQVSEKEREIARLNLEEQEKAQLQKQALVDKELAELQEANDIRIINLKLQKATEKEVTEATIEGLEAQLVVMEKAGMARTRAFAELKLQVQQLKDGLVPEKNSLLDRLLLGIFNIDTKVLDEVKASMEASLVSLQQSLGYIADTMFNDAFMRLDAYTAYLDEQLALSQERQDAADDALQDTLKKRESLEAQLENAKGARREYLIQKIAKERQEEARLTAEKKKAAAEEAKINAQKLAAEKERQQLEAKGRLITQAATTADAIAAAIAAVKSAAKIPFPANLLAIGASLAAVTGAVVASKKLSVDVQQAKLKNGGRVLGPSHDSGGVEGTGRFNNIEVEGDEFVTNRYAYQNNRETVEKINRLGRSMRFVAIPEHQLRRRKMADGGPLSEGAAPNAVVTGDSLPSSNELALIRAALERIEQHTGVTAAKEFSVAIDPWQSKKITDQARTVEQDERNAKPY